MTTSLACPNWAPDEIKKDWPKWSLGIKQLWLSRNKKPINGSPNQSSEVNIANNIKLSAPPELTDIRNWTLDIDGIPAERIRNCIIFHLDHAKTPFYKNALTEGYLKRVRKDLGITGARKLHEDTPPGWSPPEADPLIETRTMSFDGENLEYREITRFPKNLEERKILLGMLFDRRGLNPGIAKWLVDPKCPKCKGFGSLLIRPKMKNGWHPDKWQTCECVTSQEFKAL